MTTMKLCNCVAAIITLVAGVLIAYTSYGYGIGLTVFGPGAGFWPFCLAAGLIVVGILIIVDTLLHKEAYANETVALTLPENMSVYRMMAAVILYVALIFALGFYIATACYMTLAMRMLGEKRLGFALSISVLFCIMVYVVFTLLLHVTMPPPVFME